MSSYAPITSDKTKVLVADVKGFSQKSAVVN
jgi:hypothetical protein